MSRATVAMGTPLTGGRTFGCVGAARSRAGSARATTSWTGVASRTRSVRLTRRGQAVAAAGILLVALVLGLALRQPPSLAGDAFRQGAPYDYVVVEPGQTLWQIAEAAAPGDDPRVTIMRIQDLNGLADASVAAGQRLALPSSR
jgi:hypothetical protein